MNNHLRTIKVLLKSNEQRNAILMMNGLKDNIASINKEMSPTSGNSIIDAIMNYGVLKCNKRKIKMTYDLEWIGTTQIKSIDISSILSNLLDNAMNAAEKAVVPVIDVKVFKYKKYVMIIVKNSYLVFPNKKGKEFPALGVTMVVTPLNYKTIEQFFLHELDLSILNWVSIEFQLYITESCYEQHSEIIKREFGVADALCARGLIRDTNDFADIDIVELIRQVNHVRDYCKERGINVIGYPKTMEYHNLSNFYTAKWDQMIDKRNRCSFPWLYVEISANGDVTPCHTFYDYTIGNINKESILSKNNNSRKKIWQFKADQNKNAFYT